MKLIHILYLKQNIKKKLNRKEMLDKLKQLLNTINLTLPQQKSSDKNILQTEENIIEHFNQKQDLLIQINQYEELEQSQHIELMAFGFKFMKNLKQINLEIDVEQFYENSSKILGVFFGELTQVNVLNITIFSDTQISDGGLKNIFQNIKNLSNIQNFFFMLGENCNTISHGIATFAESVSNLYNLTHFTLIIQKNNQISDAAVEQLGRTIHNFRMLNYLKLEITNNDLSDISTLIIHKSFKQLLNLEEFFYTIEQDLSIGDSSFLEFGQSLQYLTNLHSLSLNIVLLGISQKYLSKFSDSLQHLNQLSTFKFHLQDESKLKDKQIKELFKGFQNLKNLQFLELHIGSNNQIQHLGCEEIEKWILNLHQLMYLDLIIEQENFLGSNGLISLSRGLKQLQQLKSLYISIDDEFREEVKFKVSCDTFDLNSILELSTSIKQMKCLKELSLEINSLYSLNFICLIQNEQIKSSNQINLRYFSKLNFSKEYDPEKNEGDIVKLSFTINSYSRIKQFGSLSLALGLKELVKLNYLSINIGLGNNIGCQGSQEISNALKNLVNLKTLNLIISYTKLNLEGAVSLAKAIQHLTKLSQLTLFIDSENNIGYGGAKSLGETISGLTQLKFLSITIGAGNYIYSNGAVDLLKDFHNLINLNHLYINIITDRYILNSFKYFSFVENLQSLRYLFIKFNQLIPSTLEIKRKIKRLVVCN